MSSNRVIEALIANGWVETSTPGRYKSKSISHSQTTSVTIENIRQISFNYSISSEGNCDWFNFYINGTQKIHKSGTTSSSFEYSSDTPFNIKFEYTKDGSVNSADDCVYISNIKCIEPVDLELDNGVIITYFEEKRIIGENYDYIVDISNNLWIKGDGKLLGIYDEFTKIEDITNIKTTVSLLDTECIYIDTNDYYNFYDGINNIRYTNESKYVKEDSNYYIVDTSNNLWIKGDGKLLGTYDEFTKIEDISDIQDLISLTDNECIYIDTSNNLWIKGEKYNKIYDEFTLIEGYDINELINFINYTDYRYLLTEDEISIMNDINNGNWEAHFSTEEEKNEFIINLYNKYEINEEMFVEKENEYKEYLINLYEKYLYTNTFRDSEDNKGKEYKIRIKNLEADNSVYLFDSYIKNYKYRQIDDIYSDSIDEYSFKYELIENNIHKFSYKTLPGDYSLSIDDNLNGDIKVYLDGEEYNLIQYNSYFTIFIDDKTIEHNIEILYDGNDLDNFYWYINRFIKRSVKINSDKYYLKISGNNNFDITENNIKYIDFIFDTRNSNNINYYINKYLNETTKNSYQIELIKKNEENIKCNNSYNGNELFGIYKFENENNILFKFIKPVSSTPFYNNTTGIKIVSIKKQCTKMSFYYKTTFTNGSDDSIILYIDGIYKNRYYSGSWTQAVIDNLTDEEHEFTLVLYNYYSNYYSSIDTIAFNDIVETDSSLFSNNCTLPLANIPTISEYINDTNSSTPFYNNTTGIKIVSIKKQCTKMSFYYKTKSGYMYLYIDGVYKNRYSNSSWRQVVINNLTDEEHEFTWVLYNYSDYYSCIDTIAFNDIVETDSSLFSNNGTLPLADIPTDSKYTVNEYMELNYLDISFSQVYYELINMILDIDYLNRQKKYFENIKKLNNIKENLDVLIFNDLETYFLEKEKKIDDSDYINNTNSSTPFYFNTEGIKIVSIKKQCTKMSFYYKTGNSNANYNSVYLYIDGEKKSIHSKTSWTQVTIYNLTDEEHEFTWVLYCQNNNWYSCIDTIAFNDIVETNSSLFSNTHEKELKDSNSKYINGLLSTTPFYINTTGVKIVSIKKQCTKMSFYFKVTTSGGSYNSVFLYIDGIYKERYYNNSNTSWTQITIDNLTDEEHEFTWVLYNYNSDYYSCIDTIAFNDIVETNSSLFSNTHEKELKDSNSKYINGLLSTTPFYINTEGIKIVSIKKQCTKMSFYYKTSDNSSYYNSIYLYIDGVYKSKYVKTSWTQVIINNLTDEEHEFTWVLHSNSSTSSYSSIDTIAFNDILEIDSSLFSNTYEKELKNSYYINGLLSTTPFYNKTIGFKIVSIKKKCTKMSFYFKTGNRYSNNNSIYLYIDGVYKSKYVKTSWTQVIINNLTDEEHEFTWVLYTYSDYYSCIDTIAFNDIVETDSSKFSNNSNIQLPLADIPTNDNCYKNDTNSSTPFYNNTIGFKIVSIKKQCTKMSFYFKNFGDSYMYLYIDGVYKERYYNINYSWVQIEINDLTDEEHEFTWVLYNYNDSYYSCIDTIAFNDIVETDSSLFSNNCTLPLANIPTISEYINDTNSSTPFYNNTTGIKIVSIKKQCTKMSFYYYTYNTNYSYNSIYLYIDGIYKNRYTNNGYSWVQIEINDLTDEEHEFTWVLYNYNDSYYSCIDTIAFNDILEIDSSLFSNTYEKGLKDSNYTNGSLSTTPFYNKTIGFKIVSIKKQCTKMSFYYRVEYNNSLYNNIFLYIDGIYNDKYNNTSWTQIEIDDLVDEEHEFTWVLYTNSSSYYSSIDTIAFNDILETDSSKFNDTYNKELKYEFNYIVPEKDIPFSEQQVKLNEEKYNNFILTNRKNKIFKINPNNYSELESILQSPDIVDLIVSNENGDHIVLTSKAKQRIFTRDIDTNEPNIPFIIKSNPDAIGSLKVSNVKTEFNKSDLKVTNEIDIDDLTNENEDLDFEDIGDEYYMKFENW